VALLRAAHGACTAAAGFAGVAALAIARMNHDRGICRTRDLFVLPRLVFVRPYGVCTRLRCVGAATLLGGAYDVCAAAAGFACVTALAIARMNHDRGICRTRDLFALPRLAFVRSYGVA
jgi:hypothetical protein